VKLYFVSRRSHAKARSVEGCLYEAGFTLPVCAARYLHVHVCRFACVFSVPLFCCCLCECLFGDGWSWIPMFIIVIGNLEDRLTAVCMPSNRFGSETSMDS
jgi:hypothetical protein